VPGGSAFLLLFVLASIAYLATASLWVVLRRTKGTRRSRLKTRANSGAWLLSWQLLWVGVMTTTGLAQLWTPRDVGTPVVHPLAALAGGASFYPLVYYAAAVLYQAFGLRQHSLTNSVDSLRRTYPRSKRQKCYFAIGLAGLNPITEEWMFRGVAVHWLYSLTGTEWTVVIGFLASIAAHAYQGRTSLVFHGLFTAAACYLVLSPLGLPGAIGLHLVGDGYPLVVLRRSVGLWKEQKRRLRKDRRRDVVPEAA